MKKYLLVTVVVLFAAVGVFAQTASDSITVTATNNGVFTFTITEPTYAFGTVDANGSPNVAGDESLTGATNVNGAVYTSIDASTWEVRSAPSRTVRIFNASVAGDATIAWGTANRLAMSIPAASNSCGFIQYLVAGDGVNACANGNLRHSFTAGNGGNSATGDLDFQLTVDNTDIAGSNTWIVTLTAAGA